MEALPENNAPSTTTKSVPAPTPAPTPMPARPALALAHDAAKLAPRVVHEVWGQGGAVEQYTDKIEGADAGFVVDVNGDGVLDSDLRVV